MKTKLFSLFTSRLLRWGPKLNQPESHDWGWLVLT